jgi:phage terminase large subunit GpA-like protein
MFQESPPLKDFWKGGKFNKTEISLPNGGHIEMAWASSVAKLATREAKIVILDEIDKPGYYIASKEASPISLARERTETFFDGKIFLLSTPTIDTGNITKELESCDVIYDFHVPCPYCGEGQPLRWSKKHSYGFDDGLYRNADGKWRELGQVKWSGGIEASEKQIEKAGYQCGSCRKIWNTVEKNRAVELGEMVPREPPDRQPRKVGFHINRLYSLLGKSGDIPKLVANFISVYSDPKKLQGFVNSTLAEPWKKTITKATEQEILSARCDLGPQIVPSDAIALTAGIDPQKHGFWFSVRAWDRIFTSWLIHYGKLGTWEDVEHLLFDTTYPIEGKDKATRIWRAAIDSGGGKTEDQDPSMTEKCYWWVRRNMGRGCQIWATKGSSRELTGKIGAGKFLDRMPSGKPIPGGLQLVLLDTDKCKDMFHYRLAQAREQGDQAAYLHSGTEKSYADQIMAEEKQLDEKGLQTWVRIHVDNHYLDTEVLSMACADPEWIGGGVNLLARAIEIELNKKKAIDRARNDEPGSGFKRPDMSKIRERLNR